MATNEASVKMSADDSQLAAAWQRQFALMQQAVNQASRVAGAMEGLAGKMDKVGEAADKVGKSQSSGFGALPGAINHSIQLATKLLEVFKEINNAQVKRSEQAIPAGLEEDELLRNFLVQTGNNQRPPTRNTDQIKALLSQRAYESTLDFRTTALTATEAASQGFTGDLLQPGDVVPLLLSAMRAMNVPRGEDPRAFVKGMAKYLSATGQDKNRDSLYRAVIGLFNLFKNTPIQAADLERLAEDAATMKELGNLSGDEIMAQYSMALESFGVGEGSTKMRSLIQGLTTLRTMPRKRKFAYQMGLEDSDLDFNRLGWTKVMQNLRRAYDSTAKDEGIDQANAMMGRVLTEESLSYFLFATDPKQNRLEGIGNRIKAMQDSGAFKSAVVQNTTGASASTARSGELLRRAQTNAFPQEKWINSVVNEMRARHMRTMNPLVLDIWEQRFRLEAARSGDLQSAMDLSVDPTHIPDLSGLVTSPTQQMLLGKGMLDKIVPGVGGRHPFELLKHGARATEWNKYFTNQEEMEMGSAIRANPVTGAMGNPTAIEWLKQWFSEWFDNNYPRLAPRPLDETMPQLPLKIKIIGGQEEHDAKAVPSMRQLGDAPQREAPQPRQRVIRRGEY